MNGCIHSRSIQRVVVLGLAVPDATNYSSAVLLLRCVSVCCVAALVKLSLCTALPCCILFTLAMLWPCHAASGTISSLCCYGFVISDSVCVHCLIELHLSVTTFTVLGLQPSHSSFVSPLDLIGSFFLLCGSLRYYYAVEVSCTHYHRTELIPLKCPIWTKVCSV